jgi:hypothetical protein
VLSLNLNIYRAFQISPLRNHSHQTNNLLSGYMQSCFTVRICEGQFCGDIEPSERFNKFGLYKLRHVVFVARNATLTADYRLLPSPYFSPARFAPLRAIRKVR